MIPFHFFRDFFLFGPRLQLEQSLRVPHPALIKFLRRLALGVFCVDGRALREQLAKERGRRRVPGRPVTWGTTEQFLDQFGIEHIEDLPGIEELKAAGLLDARPGFMSLGQISDGSDNAASGSYEKDEGDISQD